MKRKFSIYHFLIALIMFTLMSPAFVGATVKDTEPTTGTLTIHKLALEPDVEPGEKGDGNEMEPAPEGEPVKDVIYKLKQTHTFDGHKWKKNTDGQVYTMTTDVNGEATETLPLGRYKVTEVSGPPHIIVNDEPFTVDIPLTSKDGSDLNYDVHVYPKNKLIRGGAELIKYANETDETLDGVKIKVFHADGTPVKKEGTEEDIILTTKDGKVKVEGLRYGEYYFQEIESIEGYLLNKEKVPFSVTENGAIEKVHLQNYSPPEVDKDVDKPAVNRGEIVEFTINVNLPKDIKKYTKFNVSDVLHENLIYIAESANVPTGFTFNYDNETRTLTWTGTPNSLTPGEVTFKFKAKVSREATANEPIENEAEVQYDNRFVISTEKSPSVTVTPTVGSLKVIKKDGKEGTLLQGAKFELRQGDEVIASGTTNSDGEIFFGDLDYGNYTLHETKAPDGYSLITKPIDIEIGGGEDNHDVSYVVKNYKSAWELPKTGGIGTILYSLVGLTLMGTAGVMYTRRRRGEQA